MADVEGRVVWKAFAQLCDVCQPLDVEAVPKEAVPVVVDLVAEENGLRFGSEDPGAVVG